jgi:phosphotriesterase-related protein
VNYRSWQKGWSIRFPINWEVVISHDANFKHQLTKYGGKGIAHILDNIEPRLRRRGVTADQIDALLVRNPRRALNFA